MEVPENAGTAPTGHATVPWELTVWVNVADGFPEVTALFVTLCV
jgi:hypothetical protein